MVSTPSATSTLTLGNKVSGFSIAAPADRTPNGRKVTVAAFSDGNVTATGTVTAHQGDSWTVGILNWLGSTAPTVGQKTSANSIPVVIASDQSAVAATGTITASDLKFDLQFAGDGVNTLSVYAVSLVEYES